MLSTQNLKLLNQPSKKFRFRYIGPYKIIEKISSRAYKLDFPLNMKVHPACLSYWIVEKIWFFTPCMDQRYHMIYLHQTFLSMVMILFMFTPLLITKLLLTLKLMPKAQLSYWKSNGSDTTLQKTLGNHIWMLQERIA